MEIEKWVEIHRLRRDDVPIRQIARDLDISRNTVRRALADDAPPGPRTRASPGSAIDAYEQQMVELLRENPTISTAEIGRRLGWSRSHTVLKDRVRVLRARLEPDDFRDRDRDRARAHPPTLPAELTSFVGRRRELKDLHGLLRAKRLVTLIGPGGIGKTRLAVRAASDAAVSFPDGTWFVRLDTVRVPDLVAQSILDGLGVGDPSQSTGDPIPRLVDYLQRRRGLLVLDNCEHLVGHVAPLVEHLLQRAPGLTVLTTSQQPLAILGEHVVQVAPLETSNDDPEKLDQLLASPAARLFADRAVAALPSFVVTQDNQQLVALICRALEGIPLAIELATVRLQVLSLSELLERLDHRLSVLTNKGSAAGPERQRTLQATIEWSYELCTDDGCALWARASVFSGGFDVGSATAVCADETLPAQDILDALAGLVAKSILIREEHDGHVRFRMLETIREFGQAKLTPEHHHELRRRHLDWCQRLVASCADQWFGADQVRWKQRMRQEQSNLRCALEHALDPVDGDTRAAQQLVGTSWILWATALSLTEHRRWLHRALDSSTQPTPERARALTTCAFVAGAQGDLHAAEAIAEEGLELAKSLGLPDEIAHATHILGLAMIFSGQTEPAKALLEEALEHYGALGVRTDFRMALETHLGMYHLSRGDLDEAEAHLRVVDRESAGCGETWARSFALDGLGYVALARGDRDVATGVAREGLRLAAKFDETIGLAYSIELSAWIAVAHDQPGRAATLLGAASALWDSFGHQLYGSRFWQQGRTQYATVVRDALGNVAFEVAHDRGAGLSHAAAVRLALESGDDDAREQAPSSVISSRERKVAELVAQGLTNREIGERLFLSHRTVEGHVSRALEKLGLQRRSQLAAWISKTR